MTKVYAIQEKRSAKLAEAQKLVDAGLSTAEQKASYKDLIAEADLLEGDIRNLQRIERAIGSSAMATASTPAPVIATKTTETTRSKIDAAWRNYLIEGRNGLNINIPEQRDLSTTSDADGSAFIPQTYEAQWIEAVKQFGPLAGLVSVSRTTTGAPRKLAISDDTASTMTYMPETNSTSSIEEDPVFFSAILGGADTLASSVVYSKQEAADAEDIGAFLKSLAYGRAARALEFSLLTGTDSGTNTQLPHSPAGGLLAQAPTGVTGVALTGPTYAQMAALAASVDVAYRNAPNAGFYVNPTTFAFLVAQVDSTGRPLYAFGDDGLLRVAGKPVYVSAANAMASYSVASSVVALFGDYSKALKLVDVGGVRLRVFPERYADQFLNLGQITQRISAAILVSGAVKSMTTTT
jgi:HK97 family phage major capsid protein